MAVRAEWEHVPHGVHTVNFIHARKGLEMMDVDKTFSVFAICLFEIKSAAHTDCTVMPDTGLYRGRISFISVNGNDFSGAFGIQLRSLEFIGTGVADNIGIPHAAFLSRHFSRRCSKPLIDATAGLSSFGE